jgi:hypothetical protein
MSGVYRMMDEPCRLRITTEGTSPQHGFADRARPEPRGDRSVRTEDDISVELRVVGPPYRVFLSSGARSRIEREIIDMNLEFGEFRENGGRVYSHYQPGVDGIELISATGPGPGSTHGSVTMQLGNQTADELGPERDRLLVGTWHAEPQGGNEAPSDVDLRTWARGLERLNVERYIGLIVRPGEIGWTTPRFRAWVVSSGEPAWSISSDDDRGRFVCEPATVDY